ncbi:hypothetical protein B2A_12938, partial [mine drainage metagenome]
QAAEFIRSRLVSSGELQGSFCAGVTRGPAFLHDHAFLLTGLLELLKARWQSSWYDLSLGLADALLARFEDRDRGGFWFTADDQPVTLMRPKIWVDDATPAANALAARALALLGHLSGNSSYAEAATRTIDAARPHIESDPASHLGLITSAWILNQPECLMILRGDPDEFPRWRSAIEATAAPGYSLFAIPVGAEVGQGWLSHCVPRGPACLYVCSGTRCSAPVTSLSALHTFLAGWART